jgi:hypothetical protein
MVVIGCYLTKNSIDAVASDVGVCGVSVFVPSDYFDSEFGALLCQSHMREGGKGGQGN